MDLGKIGKYIAKKRKENNLTQEELASILNVNNRTVSRWEHGVNMPDISMYKDICDALHISIEELINGEDNINNDGVEKAIIKTLNENRHERLKNKIYLLFIIILILLLIFILIYYKSLYPKVNINGIDIIDNENCGIYVVNKIDDVNIWFYNICSLKIIDNEHNYYDYNIGIKYNQFNMDDIKDYLNNQVSLGNLSVNYLLDGGTSVYKNDEYQIIFCNTIEGNKDIYFGNNNMFENISNNICGRTSTTKCKFIRTYHIIETKEYDKEFMYVTLEDNDNNIETVIINNGYSISAGKIYKFTFSTEEEYEDNIKNIFAKSTLYDIKETDDYIDEDICVS